MEYISIFDFPPWKAVGVSVFQSVILFSLILLGLRLAGRRVFAERSPQDLVIIVLVGEACNQGLADQSAGYWGSLASVITLIILGALTERIVLLRHMLNEPPIRLYENGELDQDAMKKCLLDESDLNEAARQRGLTSYEEFETIILEGDGRISGTFKSRNK